MSKEEFSIEQSEQLIANLKSGLPSEFEQLRSALNLLAHVPQISPVATPPVLPSSIIQPAAVVPIKSSKPRRTIVTSIVVLGLFASGSLAAAAVTGIGPSVFVNAGHSAARFVKNVVTGVSNVVTGNDSASNQNQAAGDVNPGGSAPTPSGSTTLPATSLNPTDSNNENETELSSSILPLISTLIPPLTSPIVTNPSGDSQENETQTPSSSHENQSQSPTQENQSQSPEDSPQSTPRAEKSPSSSEDLNQSESHPIVLPTPEAPAAPSAEPTVEPNVVPTIESSILPSAEPTDQTEPEN